MEIKDRQPFPFDTIHFLTKFLELMSQITHFELFYEVNLREISSESFSLYGKWVKNLVAGIHSSEYQNKLQELEFQAYKQIYDDIAKKAHKLVKSLNRLFWVDTSKLNSVIESTRQEKLNAEQYFTKENRPQDGINQMKDSVEKLFETFSDFKTNRKNIERKALIKWLGGIGGAYSIFILAYFQILGYMDAESNFAFGVAFPVGVGLFLVLLVVAIFSQDEPT